MLIFCCQRADAPNRIRPGRVQDHQLAQLVARRRNREKTSTQGGYEDGQRRWVACHEAAQGGGRRRQGDGRHFNVPDDPCQPREQLPSRKGNQPMQGLKYFIMSLIVRMGF